MGKNCISADKIKKKMKSVCLLLAFFVCINADCIDKDGNCNQYKGRGYCKGGEFQHFMKKNCQKTCDFCDYETKHKLKCPEPHYNVRGRTGVEQTKTKSWIECANRCHARSDCNYWVWHNEKHNQWKYICITLTGFEEKVYDYPVTIGARDCYDDEGGYECYDRDRSCQGFAEGGNCGKSKFQDYVETYCRKSCKICK